jgi:hypothetical protein
MGLSRVRLSIRGKQDVVGVLQAALQRHTREERARKDEQVGTRRNPSRGPGGAPSSMFT